MKEKFLVVVLIVFSMMLCACQNETVTTTKKEEVKSELQEDQCYQYFYSTLNKKEKIVYEEIYTGIKNMKKRIEVSCNDESLMREIYEKVVDDHPELFYCKSIYPLTDDKEGEVIVHYEQGLTKKDVQQQQKQVEEKVDQIIAQVDASASDYEKAKFVYDYLTQNCEYVEGSKDNQDARSVFFYGQSVCAGYAHAAQILLNRLGVPCAYISGKAKDEEQSLHAWNMVKMNQDYYYMDTTWGDVVDPEHTCYGYFMMSETEMNALYEADNEVMPTQKYDNYFIENNRYLESYDDALITSAIKQAFQNNTLVVEIKCSPQCYEEVKRKLFDEYQIFNLLDQEGYYYDSITHIENDAICIIDIFL